MNICARGFRPIPGGHRPPYPAPFPGIEDLLNRCVQQGIAWGVATNKPWRYTEPLMGHFNFARSAAVTLCPEHAKPKPDPAMLLLACQQIGCTLRRLFI